VWITSSFKGRGLVFGFSQRSIFYIDSHTAVMLGGGVEWYSPKTFSLTAGGTRKPPDFCSNFSFRLFLDLLSLQEWLCFFRKLICRFGKKPVNIFQHYLWTHSKLSLTIRAGNPKIRLFICHSLTFVLKLWVFR